MTEELGRTPTPPSRVAFITANLALGGATTFLLNLLSELRSAGSEALLLNLEGPTPPEFAVISAKVETLPDERRWFEGQISWALQRLGQFRPEAVVANLSPISFEPLRYAPSGVTRIGMAHTDDPNVYLLAEYYGASLDYMVAVSERIKDEFLRRQVRPQSVQLIHYGVPMPPDDWRRRPNAHNPLRVLYLGRLSAEQKRADLLPAIRRHVIGEGISTKWTIAGDGPLRQSLETQFANSDVEFTGAVPYSQVGELLERHDVLLLPSAYEGLPLSILEAMAWEAVPVVSDIPSGVREVIDEQNGVLVDPNDTEGYSRALVALARDRERLEALGRNARARVHGEFSASAMLRRWIPILHGNSEHDWPVHATIRPPIGAERSLRFFPPIRWIVKRLHALRR